MFVTLKIFSQGEIHRVRAASTELKAVWDAITPVVGSNVNVLLEPEGLVLTDDSWASVLAALSYSPTASPVVRLRVEPRSPTSEAATAEDPIVLGTVVGNAQSGHSVLGALATEQPNLPPYSNPAAVQHSQVHTAQHAAHLAQAQSVHDAMHAAEVARAQNAAPHHNVPVAMPVPRGARENTNMPVAAPVLAMPIPVATHPGNPAQNWLDYVSGMAFGGGFPAPAAATATAQSGWQNMRKDSCLMLTQAVEIRGERRHILRSMITGRVRIVDSEVILEDTMLTGAVSLEGTSRLTLIRGMITGSVTHSPTSVFDNSRGGMVTGCVRRSHI